MPSCLKNESKIYLYSNPLDMTRKDAKGCSYVFFLEKESRLHYYCLTPLGW